MCIRDRIGMDVHSTNYTLCAMEPVIGAEDRIFANITVSYTHLAHNPSVLQSAIFYTHQMLIRWLC